MEEQVSNAVQVALNPEAEYTLKQQALEFIAQVKDSPDAWRAALALLSSQPVRPSPVRHFALQILDSAIKRSFYNNVEAFEQTKILLLGFLDPSPSQQYIRLQDETPYVQNQAARSLTLLFVLSYTTTWPTFFDDCLSLIQKPTPSSPRRLPFSPFQTHIFLRVLSMIDEEVADALYTSTKKQGDQRLNAEVKDRIRVFDVRKITELLSRVMTVFDNDEEHKELVRQSLQVVGQWIAWIDITLIANDAYIALIYRYLGYPGLRTTAAETLSSIISKKMRSSDKLSLITFLNLTQVVNTLNAEDEDLEFSESLARLVNAQGLELTRILTEMNPAPELREKGLRALRDLLPLLLRFLADEYDEISTAVFPFLTDLLSQSRRSLKRTGIEMFDRDFMQALLQALFKKLRYDNETPTPGDDDSEIEAEFHDMRKRLLSFQESIASLDPELFSRSIHQIVTSTFQAYISGETDNWRDLEVALFELHAFAEPLKVNGLWEGTVHAKRFMEMLSLAIRISPKLGDPLSRILVMEIAVRYAVEIQSEPDTLIPTILQVFVGHLGIHARESQAQLRAWYLFERFLGKLDAVHLTPLSSQLLASFTDLLPIRVTIKSGGGVVDSDSESESETDLVFDNQLYLFQAAGLLMARGANLQVGEALIQELCNGITERLTVVPSAVDQELLGYIHHSIMAIGDVAKGFEGGTPSQEGSVQQVGTQLFAPASEVILKALERFEDSSYVRDATRYAFVRLVNVMGENILGKIPPLIGGLLRKSTTWELIDFLPFLGQLIHKFKPTIQTFLDELMLPLLSRIFESLNKPVEGTDDVIEQTSMRKAYLSFIMTLFNNRMESIFVSQASRSKFDAVLESIIHYATDTSDATVEKVAFGVLNKMVVVWSTPSSEPDPLEKEFHEAFGQFVIQHLSRVCFEVPSKTSFNSNDAQSRLVLAEIAGLQKSIFQMKGDLFVSYLQNSFFPSLGVSPEAASEYVRALQQLDLKQFKKFFVVCYYF